MPRNPRLRFRSIRHLLAITLSCSLPLGVAFGGDETPHVNSITFGDGKFVAVGDSGLIQVSEDGYNWEPSNTVFSDDIVSVVYGNGKYVASAKFLPTQTARILTSENGYDWLVAFETTGYSANQLCYGNGTFMWSRSSSLFRSENTTDWEPVELPQPFDGIASAVFGKGRFFAISHDTAQFSTDGKKWTFSNHVIFGIGVLSLPLYEKGSYYIWSFHFHPWGFYGWQESNDLVSWDQVFYSGYDWVEETGVRYGVVPEIGENGLFGKGVYLKINAGAIETTAGAPPGPTLYFDDNAKEEPELCIECAPDVSWVLERNNFHDPDSNWLPIAEFTQTNIDISTHTRGGTGQFNSPPTSREPYGTSLAVKKFLLSEVLESEGGALFRVRHSRETP